MLFHAEDLKNNTLLNQYLGRLAENYILTLLQNKYQYISFYKKGDKEIDFVAGDDYLDKKNLNLFEVKYVNQLRRSDFGFLQKTAQNIFKTDNCFVYSKKDISFEQHKTVLPCFLVR